MNQTKIKGLIEQCRKSFDDTNEKHQLCQEILDTICELSTIDTKKFNLFKNTGEVGKLVFWLRLYEHVEVDDLNHRVMKVVDMLYEEARGEQAQDSATDDDYPHYVSQAL